jgi:peroxiredoxin
MFPHERSLVKRLEDKPFALLGISVDKSKDELKRVTVADKLTWRSWWDADKKIASQYEVQALPSIYILDARGVIRFTPADFGGDPEEIDKEVNRLLDEAGKS